MKSFDLSLYLVLDPVLCAGIGMVETARIAVAGGATIGCNCATSMPRRRA